MELKETDRVSRNGKNVTKLMDENDQSIYDEVACDGTDDGE